MSDAQSPQAEKAGKEESMLLQDRSDSRRTPINTRHLEPHCAHRRLQSCQRERPPADTTVRRHAPPSSAVLVEMQPVCTHLPLCLTAA